MTIIYLGLGSNIGDTVKNLQICCEKLQDEEVEIIQKSSVYRTEPEKLKEQPFFLNMALKARYLSTPEKLHAVCERIEKDMGRNRLKERRWGPRIIDIDILLFGKKVIKNKRLSIPHGSMRERKFVLIPLLEISPSLKDPLKNRPFRDYVKKGWPKKVERLGRLEILAAGKS